MVKLESLKKSNQFKKALKEKKVHTDYFSIFAAKNFFKPKYKSNLLISFVMKKKIGNAVKRNYAKRLMRSLVYRQSDELASSFDYVFIARQAILNKKFYLIESEIMRALKHLNKSIIE